MNPLIEYTNLPQKRRAYRLSYTGRDTDDFIVTFGAWTIVPSIGLWFAYGQHAEFRDESLDSLLTKCEQHDAAYIIANDDPPPLPPVDQLPYSLAALIYGIAATMAASVVTTFSYIIANFNNLSLTPEGGFAIFYVSGVVIFALLMATITNRNLNQ